MKTSTLTISASWLYDKPDSYALVPVPGTSERRLITRWGTYAVIEANHQFVRGLRLPDEVGPLGDAS